MDITHLKIIFGGMVAHTFNSSIWESEAGDLFEFETSLIDRASSRTARATQRNPALKKQANQPKQKNKKLGFDPGVMAHIFNLST